MSEEQDSTTNTAERGSTVAIQAQCVHNPRVNVWSSEHPPEKIFEFGRNYLAEGVPARARELIRDAIARGYAPPEVRFHLVLALLSTRSYRELTVDERNELRQAMVQLDMHPGDEWSRGLEVLCELLEHLDSAERDPAPALNKVKSLPAPQRDKIVGHCDLVLTGGMKDSLWAETRRAAKENQLAGDRSDRAWAYFHPEPATPRSRQPAPSTATGQDWVRAGLATGLLATGLGILGWILLQHPTTIGMISYMAGVTCGAVAVRSGFVWRYRTWRLATKERDFARINLHEAPKRGFANRVDHDFDYYAHRYAPKGADRSAWLADTRGIRTTLRNEVVELYREQRVESDQVRWLIRYLIQDLRTQWRRGTLFSYCERYWTPLSIKTLCVAGLTFAVLAAVAAIDAVVLIDPVPTLGSVLMLIMGARFGMLPWWRLVSERRRIADESADSRHARKGRTAAYNRWKHKLDSTRPTEHEMQMWLECDKLLLIEEALQHYNLAWRNIIAHTIVQSPAPCRRRARRRDGPWRYQRYLLQLFLITTDGVRELNRHLNFETGTFRGRERGHFRFDAVSSLQVTESERYNYTLELTLTNGPARIIDVTEPQQDLEYPSEPDPDLSQVTLDSAGFNHTLYVLEGIAAEGKAWIHHANTPGTTHTFSKIESTA